LGLERTTRELGGKCERGGLGKRAREKDEFSPAVKKQPFPSGEGELVTKGRKLGGAKGKYTGVKQG